MRGSVVVRGIAGILLVAGGVVAAQHLPRVYAATTSGAANSSQAQIDANNQQITELNKQIAIYEAEIKKAGADKKTLQSAINALDLKRRQVEAQIALTQHQIASTQVQIQQLASGIATTQQSIQANQAALEADVRNLQRADQQPLILQMFSSTDLSQVWSDVDATLQVQSAIQDQVVALKAQEQQLATSKQASKQKQQTLVSQRNTLSSRQTSLTQTKQTKAQLLAETDAKESRYQQLLAEAKKELESFSSFTANAGGSGLLKNQTKCDAWGCYYNQRDVAWGNDPLNGTKYRLKSDGCLVTAMAMVMTHYGYRNVTPVTINANPSNFAAYYPAYLLFTINVDGVSATRKAALIDQTLATGNPVIVGLHAYGGTHFVVLTSGSHGHYIMRDPYVPNADGISFNSHYSMSQIYGVRKVVISKA